MMRLRTLRLIARLAVVAFLVLAPAMLASASVPANPPIAQEEAPYTPPEFEDVDVPGWLQPFEPLARLPLWGQAAALSAGVAGMFFVVPMVFRWVWNLGQNGAQGGGEPGNGKNGKSGKNGPTGSSPGASPDSASSRQRKHGPDV